MFLSLCLMNLTLIVPTLNRIQRRYGTHSSMHVHVQISPSFMQPKCTVHFVIISHPGSSSGSGVHLNMFSPRIQVKLISPWQEASGMAAWGCKSDQRTSNCRGKADPTGPPGRKPLLDHDGLDLAQGQSFAYLYCRVTLLSPGKK